MDGEKLELKPFELKDGLFWQRLLVDPQARLNFCAFQSEKLNQTRKFLENGQKHSFWSQNGDFIGGAIIGQDDNLAFFGYAIMPEWRGKGLATQCVDAIEAFCKTQGVRTIRTNVAADNLPSIRTLEKRGYRRFRLLEKNI